MYIICFVPSLQWCCRRRGVFSIMQRGKRMRLPWTYRRRRHVGKGIQRSQFSPLREEMDETRMDVLDPSTPFESADDASSPLSSSVEKAVLDDSALNSRRDCFGTFRSWMRRHVFWRKTAREEYQRRKLHEAMARLRAARLVIGSKISAAQHQQCAAERDMLNFMEQKNVRSATEAMRSKKFFAAKVFRLEQHQRVMVKNELMLQESQTNEEVFAALTDVAIALKGIGVTPADVKKADAAYDTMSNAFSEMREFTEALQQPVGDDDDIAHYDDDEEEMWKKLLADAGGHEGATKMAQLCIRETAKPTPDASSLSQNGSPTGTTSVRVAKMMPRAPTRPPDVPPRGREGGESAISVHEVELI